VEDSPFVPREKGRLSPMGALVELSLPKRVFPLFQGPKESRSLCSQRRVKRESGDNCP